MFIGLAVNICDHHPSEISSADKLWAMSTISAPLVNSWERTMENWFNHINPELLAGSSSILPVVIPLEFSLKFLIE